MRFYHSFLACLFLVSGATIVAENSSPTVIAHRGFSKLAPENTLSSFSKALEHGIEFIEFDVHLTKDGAPIIIHDGTIGRTTDGFYLKKTTDLTLNEVKSLDVGSWFDEGFIGEKIPTLNEVLQLVQGSAKLMVEVKKDNSPPKEIAQTVVSILNEYQGEFIVGSFSPAILAEVANLAPNYHLIGILEDPKMLAPFRESPIKHLAILYQLLSAELIEELHKEGIKVWVFTVDNPGLAKFLASINVDGIISNNPKAIQEALK